jgi:hypothetical protein
MLRCMILVFIAWTTADAAAQHAPVPLAGDVSAGESYFVDFHARRGQSLVGHAFIVYGRLNAGGKILQAQVAGHFPSGRYPWKGIFVPVRGSVGHSKYDFVEPSLDIYRRRLTSAEFRQLSTMVRQLKAIDPAYHLIFFNCNDFVGEAAESIGLRRPPSVMLPATSVGLLRALNEH